jgi:hypothetical protein
MKNHVECKAAIRKYARIIFEANEVRLAVMI